MSDADLRRLERAARLAPGDLDAGRAYARALERAGDRRAHHMELRSLARRGDAEAERAVARWNPWPGPGSLGSSRRAPRAGLRSVRRVRRVELPLRSRPPARLLAATDSVVLLVTDSEIVAVSLDDLAVRWRVPAKGVLVGHLRGDELVHVDRDELVVRDVLTGEVEACVPLPAMPRTVTLADDFAVVEIARTETERYRVLGLDLGERFGARLWDHFDHALSILLDEGDAVFVLIWATGLVEAWSLATGDVIWRCSERPIGGTFIGRPIPRYPPHMADGRGVIASDGLRGFAELDRKSGQVRWSCEAPGDALRSGGLFALGEEVFVRAPQAPGTAPAVTAVARTTGATLWSWPLPVGCFELAVADGVVSVLEAGAVAAFDALTGEPLFERRLEDLPRGMHRAHSVVPLGARVLVLVSNESRTAVHLLE